MTNARVVIGDNAARWHATSPLYGEVVLPHARWHGNTWHGEAVARAYVVTSFDAHRHDL